MRLKYEKVIHHAIVNNLFGFGYTKKSCNAQGSSKYYLFVTAPFFIRNNERIPAAPTPKQIPIPILSKQIPNTTPKLIIIGK